MTDLAETPDEHTQGWSPNARGCPQNAREPHPGTGRGSTRGGPSERNVEPVVRTVGDLTARHQLARPRIRVAGREGKLKIVKPSDAFPGTVTLIWGDCWEDAALEEPCEVLP